MKNLLKISLLTIIVCFPVFVNAQNEKYSGGNGDGFASSSFENKGAPGSFAAVAGSNAIELAWQQNTDSDNVIIAFNTSDSFGDPEGGSSYSVNDVLSGGGTIIFNDSAASYLHTGLSATTTYYYKAWSVNGTTYSTSGVTANATTLTLDTKYSGGNSDGYSSGSFDNVGVPISFTAVGGVTAIELSWQQNTDNDSVMIATNTSNLFGTPSNGSSYSVNDVLSGGGTIVFNDSAATYLHTGLSATTTYYYTAWSVSDNSYSNIEVTANATTLTLDAKYSGGNGDGYGSGEILAVLPVELILFEAASTEGGVLLTWETATEINNYGFEIQRTSPHPPYQGGGAEGGGAPNPADAEWLAIGFVQGNGNSNSPKSYNFTDALVPLNTSSISYRLKQIDFDGAFEYSNTVEISLMKSLPTEFKLEQNYPNPFNPTTKIRFSVPLVGEGLIVSSSNVVLKVYDILGNELTTLVNEQKAPGTYEIEFEAANYSSGLYLYQLTYENDVQTKKMILVK